MRKINTGRSSKGRTSAAKARYSVQRVCAEAYDAIEQDTIKMGRMLRAKSGRRYVGNLGAWYRARVMRCAMRMMANSLVIMEANDRALGAVATSRMAMAKRR